MNDHSHGATPLMSKKKCPVCNTTIEMFAADNNWCPKCKIYRSAGEWKEPKCPTCGDKKIINTKPYDKCPIPEDFKKCPDCNKPEQVEDIMDFVEPEEYLKELNEDRIREAFEKETFILPNDLWEFPEANKVKAKYYCFHKGFKSRQPEIEELKNAIDLMIEDRDSFHNNLKLKDTIKDLSGISEDHVSYLKALSDSEKEIEVLKDSKLCLQEYITKCNSLLDKAVEGLEMIEHWKDAYPEDIFRPISNDTYYQMCKEWGYSVDRVSAHVLRQGVKGYSESATALLKEIQEGRK